MDDTTVLTLIDVVLTVAVVGLAAMVEALRQRISQLEQR